MRPGFTLVELLAAMVVTAMVVGASGVILTSISRTRGDIDRRMGGDAEARAALDAVTLALRNVRRPRQVDGFILEGIDDWFGDVPADRIRFFTVSRRVVREGQPESDVREVAFFLSEPVDGEPPALLRRTDPTFNGEEDAGGVIERVAGNVVGMDIAYFTGRDWLDEWDPTSRSWPVAIRVRLTVIVDPQRHTTRTLGRLINFPAMHIDQRKAQQ